MEIFVYIMCALISLLLICFVFPRARHGNDIPGPKGLPVIGCLFEFSIKTMHAKFMEYAEKYGDLVRINILGIDIITLNTMELVQKAFTDEKYKAHLNDRPSSFLGKYLFYDNKGIILTTDGNSTLHIELRKVFTKGFRVYGDGIKVFEDKVLNEIVDMKSDIKAICNAEFDLVSILKGSVSNRLSVFLSGEQIKDRDDVDIFWDFNQASSIMYTAKANAVYSVAPFMRFLPGTYRDHYQRVLAARGRIHEKYLFRIKETHERGKIRGYIDFLLDEQARQIETGNEVFLTDETIKAMLQELIPTGITCDHVFANIWYIHHDERIWGDPWTFRPERFLDEKGQHLERGPHVLRKSLIPFGVGRRQCVGETFARSRIFLYTAALLQQWTFIPTLEKVGSCDPRKGDFEINILMRKESLFCTANASA